MSKRPTALTERESTTIGLCEEWLSVLGRSGPDTQRAAAHLRTLLTIVRRLDARVGQLEGLDKYVAELSIAHGAALEERDALAAQVARLREALDGVLMRCLSHAMGYLYCRCCGGEWYEAGKEPPRHRPDCPVPKAVALNDAALRDAEETR